jgi:hypothetical protein
MIVQLRPIGFVAVHGSPYPFLGIRFWRWHIALKPTRHELFSERYGYTPTRRVAGLSLSIRRVRDYT